MKPIAAMANKVEETVGLSGKLICATQDECAIVLRYLPEHIRLTRLEPGCLYFAVTQTDAPLVWRVEERFVDAAAFAAHQARAKTSEWGVMTAHIRRDYQIMGLNRS